MLFFTFLQLLVICTKYSMITNVCFCGTAIGTVGFAFLPYGVANVSAVYSSYCLRASQRRCRVVPSEDLFDLRPRSS